MDTIITQSIEQRPWGNYTVVDEGFDFKVKRIQVFAGRRLSYQRHARRSEHWLIVHGQAIVTLDGRRLALVSGDAIDIPIGAAHRIENAGRDLLTFVEIQRGSYLGEDDIVRIEDDFGRVKAA